MFQKAIAQCAKNFGPPPRHISLWDRLTYWRIARPAWLADRPQDAFNALFARVISVRRDGVVVWGHVIQANSLLFSPGDSNCPGDVVYSLDPRLPECHDELAAVASALFSLKHTLPADPDAASIAEHLSSEITRVFGKAVPESISPRLPCRMSSTLFLRKHLPEPSRCLKRSLMPLIVHPKPPHFALVLPARYWPPDLIEWWENIESD